MKLSAVILSRNEEKNIERSIKSLKFCDEIILIDDNSIDETRNIAQKFGVKVLERKLEGNFSSQRNYGLEKALGDWILFVDADEVVGEKLKIEILQEINKNSEINGFQIRRKDHIWGKELRYGEIIQAKFMRMARKGAGRWKRRVHEVWEVSGKSKILKNSLDHYPHQNLSEFINEINIYSTLNSEANKLEKKESSLFKIILIPKLKFILNYFVRLGFIDGERGLILALFMSFHSFLSWSKLWIKENQKS